RKNQRIQQVIPLYGFATAVSRINDRIDNANEIQPKPVSRSDGKRACARPRLGSRRHANANREQAMLEFMTDRSADLAKRAAAPGATLAISPIATALVLVVFTVPLTTLTVTAHALGAGPGAQAWNNTARYLGSALGLTVCAVIITHGGAASGVTGLIAGWNSAVLLSVGFSLLGALAVFLAREASLVSPAV